MTSKTIQEFLTGDIEGLIAQKFATLGISDAKEFVTEFGFVPPILWGRDHFSLALLLDDCVTNLQGNPDAIDPRKWRVDGDEYGTRLADGTRQHLHNDDDCLNDLVFAHILDVDIDTGNLVYTPLGLKVFAALRQEKSRGTTWQGFSIMPILEAHDWQAHGAA